jgi:hypothetical protein
MDDEVNALHRSGDGVGIADIQVEAGGSGDGGAQVPQPLGDRRSDPALLTGDQDPGTSKISRHDRPSQKRATALSLGSIVS